MICVNDLYGEEIFHNCFHTHMQNHSGAVEKATSPSLGCLAPLHNHVLHNSSAIATV